MPHATAEDLLSQLGLQLRAARVAVGMNQARLAAVAGVARSAVSRLEQGQGGNVHTLVCILRALGKEPWLNALESAPIINPMDMLRRATPQRQRVRMSK